MSDTLDRYRHIAGGFSARVNAVSGSAWENDSPCEGWTARDVAAHVITGARAALDRLHGVEHTEAPPPDDPAAAWAATRADVEAALADPGLAGRPVEGPMGPMPYDLFVGRLQCSDLLIHTWDLARATGGDEEVDADAAAHVLEGLRPLDAMIRRPGLFGPAVEPPPGADVVTQLMCFAGRKV